MKRISTLTCAAVLALLAAAPDVRAQSDDEIKAAIGDFLVKVKAVWKHGKTANKPLRRLKRKNKDVEHVINKLRRQVRRMPEPEAEVDADALKADCVAFVAAASKLVKFGPPASKALDAAVAAEEDEKAKDLLSRADESIYLQMADGIITPFMGQGSYDGMYDKHLEYRPKLLGAFLSIFINISADPSRRLLAGEGVAQFTRDEERADIVKALKEVLDTIDEDRNVKQTATFILARLGEREAFDKQVGGLVARMQEESKKEKPNPGVFLGVHQQLARLYQGIHDYRRTAFHYGQWIGNVLQATPYDKVSQQGRRQINGALYNFACVLSRIEELDFAYWALNQAFNMGYDDYDWATRDGDLANMRKSADRFSALITAWKDGTTKHGSPYELEAFKKHLQAIMPKQTKQTEEKEAAKPATGADAAAGVDS